MYAVICYINWSNYDGANIIILPRKTNAVIFYYYINSKFQIPWVNCKAFLNITLSYLVNLVISKQCVSITFSSSHTYLHTYIPTSTTSSLHNLPSHPWNHVPKGQLKFPLPAHDGNWLRWIETEFTESVIKCSILKGVSFMLFCEKWLSQHYEASKSFINVDWLTLPQFISL